MSRAEMRKWWSEFKHRHWADTDVHLWGRPVDTPKAVDVFAQPQVLPRISPLPICHGRCLRYHEGAIEKGWWITGHNDSEIAEILYLTDCLGSPV